MVSWSSTGYVKEENTVLAAVMGRAATMVIFFTIAWLLIGWLDMVFRTGTIQASLGINWNLSVTLLLVGTEGEF